MTKEVRRRSGTGAEHTTFTGAPAEVTVDTTDNRLVVHDGVTAGGHPVAKESEITSATADVASKLPKDGSEAMSGNLDLAGNNLVDVGNINGGPMGGFRNKVINGDFDIWQRDTSNTASTADRYLADRWVDNGIGSTETANSRQEFTLGQTDVPNNPKYFHRTVVTNFTGAADDGAETYQRIENVQTLSGKTATFTFYAKTDSGTRKAGIRLLQDFGSGGSPSADVLHYLDTFDLTTSWQKFSFTISVPSISGKTLGTDDNDYLQLSVMYCAGSDYDGLFAEDIYGGNGTFDIAHVSVVEGDATDEDDPFGSRHISQELNLCKRYYQRVQQNDSGTFTYISNSTIYNSTTIHMTFDLETEMRDVPTGGVSDVTHFQSIDTGTTRNVTGVAFSQVGTKRCFFGITSSGMAAGNSTTIRFDENTDAYIDFDAEL